MPPLDSTNVSAFCSRIDLAADRPTVDLSDVTFVTPFAVVYLGMFLRFHNSLGKSFDWRLPRKEAVEGYLESIRFYERFRFAKGFVEVVSARRKDLATSLNDIIDVERKPDIGDVIATRAADALRRVPVRIEAVASIVSELVDNFSQHSGTELPAVFTMQWFPQAKRLALALGDCGLGIRQTLRMNPQYAHVADWPDEDAIALALKQRVSCQPGHGMGLTEVVESVTASDGRMTIASGSGRVIIEPEGKLFRLKTEFSLAGVQLAVHLPTG